MGLVFIVGGPWGLLVGEATLVDHSGSLYMCLIYVTNLGLGKSAQTNSGKIIEMMN